MILKNPAVPASEGKQVPYVPSHMTSLSLLLAKGRWSGSSSGRYTGTVFNSDTNTDTTKGVIGSYNPYGLVDGSVAFKVHRHLELTATADNLLNRSYYLFYLNPGRYVERRCESRVLTP
ncbi:MAG: TonB-dependent receptor [Vicinamibacterales bacterium]